MVKVMEKKFPVDLPFPKGNGKLKGLKITNKKEPL